jgi:hypothetical protein
VHRRLPIALVTLGILTSFANADGYKLTLANNKIVARNTESFTPDYVFGHAFDVTNNVDGTYESSHGGVDANDPGSGFNFGGVNQNDLFQYNIKAMWTYDGTGAVPAEAGMSMDILNAATGVLHSQLDGQAANPRSFPIAANSTHELIWAIPQSTPTHVWALAFTITGTSIVSGQPYLESEPLVSVQWTHQFQGDTDAIMQLMYNAATGGDYDQDGDIDGRDFLVWQRTFGQSEDLTADASGNGSIDAPDLFSWQQNYGWRVGTGPLFSEYHVPEPSNIVILFTALPAITLNSRTLSATRTGYRE